MALIGQGDKKHMKPVKTFLLLACFLWFAGRVVGAPVNSQTAGTIVQGTGNTMEFDDSTAGSQKFYWMLILP